MGFDPPRSEGWIALGAAPRLHKLRGDGERFFGCGERTSGLEKTGSHQVFWNIDPPAGHTRVAEQPLHVDPVRARAAGRAGRAASFVDNPRPRRVRPRQGRPGARRLRGDRRRPRLLRLRRPDAARRARALHRADRPHRRCRRCGRSATSSRAGATRPPTRCASWRASFRERDIPCDALYLDIDYMDGYRVFTWDAERFPDPAGADRRARRAGLPGGHDRRPGREGRRGLRGLHRGPRARPVLPDARRATSTATSSGRACARSPTSRTRARARGGATTTAALLDAGVAGIWCDMNEPALFVPDAVDDARRRRAPRRRRAAAARAGPQPLRLADGAGRRARGCARLRPDRRPFVITRAGFAGLQRHALHWTGDNSSWWEHLWMSMPQLQNLGLSGVPGCGVDVGGFFGDCDGELLARWTEFGIFQPFCRNHSAMGTVPPGAVGVRRAVRERLPRHAAAAACGCCRTCTRCSRRATAPARRSCGRCCSSTPTTRSTYTADDEFLLGRRLLVAPITRPGHRAPPRLPAGAARGCTGGPASASTARRTCWRTRRSASRRSTCAPTRRSRCGRRCAHTGAAAPDPLTLRIACAPGARGRQRLALRGRGRGLRLRGGRLRAARASLRVGDAGTCRTSPPREGTWRPPRAHVVVELHGLEAPSSVQLDGADHADFTYTAGVLTVSLSESAAESVLDVR